MVGLVDVGSDDLDLVDAADLDAGAGFAGFLKKPYTEDTLIGELRQALEGDG
jgi:hypothetical protein